MRVHSADNPTFSCTFAIRLCSGMNLESPGVVVLIADALGRAQWLVNLRTK